MAKKIMKTSMKKKSSTSTAKTASKPSMSMEAMPKIRQASKPKNSGTMTYTQSEVIENLRAFCGFPKRSKAKELSTDIAAFLVDSLKRGFKIPLFGICKLQVRTSKARMGRNPQTGATIQIPARKRVRFTATKALKQAVL